VQEFLPLPSHFAQGLLTREGRFRVETTPFPELGPGDILFLTHAVGITEDDVNPRLYVNRTPPGIAVGEVAAVGDEVSGWHPNDRALLLRPGLGKGGSSLLGLGTYVLASAALMENGLVRKLPDEIPSDEATLLPAAALAGRILRESQVPVGGRLLLLGLGLIGQIVALLARHQRVEAIFAGDPSSTLRKKAEWSGVTRVIRLPEEPLADVVMRETGGMGVHAVVVLSPDATLMHEAFGTLGDRGALVLGAPFPSSLLMAFSTARLQVRELRIQGVQGFDPPDLRQAETAVRQGIVNAESLVSKRVPWAELESLQLTPDYWAHGTHVLVEGPEEEGVETDPPAA
jgi:threonine dehydrogenase-like Zn-dependent dehydrogenase